MHAFLNIRIIIYHSMPVRIQPGHHTGSGRCADSRSTERITELHSLLRKPVNMRSPADTVHPISAHRIQPLLIRQKQQNIFSFSHSPKPPFRYASIVEKRAGPYNQILFRKGVFFSILLLINCTSLLPAL